MNIHAKLHLLQVTLPYIIAGMSMVMAGMVLDVVQVGLKWILHQPFMNIHAKLHLLQVTLPCIIAGMGIVMAGMVLDVVQVGLKWILH